MKANNLVRRYPAYTVFSSDREYLVGMNRASPLFRRPHDRDALVPLENKSILVHTAYCIYFHAGNGHIFLDKECILISRRYKLHPTSVTTQ